MNILETIIRGVLIENTTKAKLRSMDAADFQTAKRAGAVFAYYAVVKGVSDEKSLMNAVAGATMGSQGTDTRVGVGASGPYANGNFMYVVNTDDINRKNVVSVWIMPALPAVKSMGGTDNSADQTEPDTKVARVGLKIGQSSMITKSSYQKRAAALKVANPSVQVADVTQMQDNTTGMQKAVAAVQDLVTKDDKTATTTTAQTSTTTTATTTPVSSYPRDVDGVKVYTMSDTDSSVYAKINGSWKFIDKKSFEANPKLSVITKKLNSAGIANVEAKFGLATSNQQQNTQQQQTQQQNTAARKVGDTLQFADKVNSKFPVYQYDSKTKKFIETAKYTITDKSKMIYQGISTSGEYLYVKLDGQKVWVNKKRIK